MTRAADKVAPSGSDPMISPPWATGPEVVAQVDGLGCVFDGAWLPSSVEKSTCQAPSMQQIVALDLHTHPFPSGSTSDVQDPADC